MSHDHTPSAELRRARLGWVLVLAGGMIICNGMYVALRHVHDAVPQSYTPAKLVTTDLVVLVLIVVIALRYSTRIAKMKRRKP